MIYKDIVLLSVILLVVFLFIVSLVLIVALIARLRTCMRLRLLEERQQRELIQLTHSAEEQQAWRREQLCRVAAILTGHNVACEGLPLTTQVPGCREVLTDPEPRRARRCDLRFLLQADGTLATVANIVAASRGGGPLPDALPAPDMLHMFISWMSRHHGPLAKHFMREAFDRPVDATPSTAQSLPAASDVYGPGALYSRRGNKVTFLPSAFSAVYDENVFESEVINSTVVQPTSAALCKNKFIYSETTAVVWLKKQETDANEQSMSLQDVNPESNCLFTSVQYS